ncbi:MAG: RIP metalloprotease RseP [Ignavibacteriae bacterium]|nr:RIP metalloprotease RseP [Ignavibacteriota bacterium]
MNTIMYFIVTLGILVFVHELGHFLAAKLFKMRVDVFSLGFPPRAFGKKFGETDYCVSWIPIGGYVKIAGMIDESFDTEYLQQEPQPWEYRSKPIWQRMIVISAGVIMNILLAVAIFWGINYTQGKSVWATTEIGYVLEGTPAASAGLMSGDKILKINDEPINDWEEVRTHVYLENLGNDLFITVLRNGKELQLRAPQQTIQNLNEGSFGITPNQTEIVINTVDPGKPAAKIGLKPMDVLLTLNGQPIRYDKKVNEIVKAHAGKPLPIEWRRGDATMRATVIPNEHGLIGISFGLRYNGPVTKIEYTLLEALPEGVKSIGSVVSLTIQGIGGLISGKTPFSQSVAGPIKIAQLASQTAELGIVTYLSFMAFLSISLAILNILPIPALDGGHLVFLAVEGIIGHELPVKMKLIIQRAGFVLLLGFMAFALFNDIRNF